MLIRSQDNDTRVTVTGAVTLPPGLYGRNIYLQDRGVGQYTFAAPWEGECRVIPRLVTDVSDAPLVLPVTGDKVSCYANLRGERAGRPSSAAASGRRGRCIR